MSQLILENMEFYAFHGHYPEEQKIGTRFSVNVSIDTDISRAAETDLLEDAIDYSQVYELVKNEMGKPSRLIEHLAKRILEAVYTVSGNITKVTVKVSKLNPAIGGSIEKFSVILSR